MRTDKETFWGTKVLIRIDFAKYEDTSFSMSRYFDIKKVLDYRKKYRIRY